MSNWLFDRILPRLTSGFATMEDIQEWILKHDCCETYSFDMFDTLVRRRIHPPQLIKALVAERISAVLSERGVHISEKEVLAQRKMAEYSLSQWAVSRGEDAEFCLDDVVAETLRVIKADGFLQTKDIVHFEVGLEKKATEPMPGAEALLIYLRSIGKRIICISDTYLSSSQVAMILEYHGLLRYLDKLYVSSDMKMNKTTGRLFEYVVEREGNRIVHIGDDYARDHVVPRKLGVKTRWFHSTREQQRKRELKRLLGGDNKMNYVNAIIRHDCGVNNGLLYHIGYGVLGPALTAFVHNVVKSAIKDDIEMLFFVARDGYIMKKIYGVLRSSIYGDGRPPAGKYLCLSRFAVRAESDDDRVLLRQYLSGVGFMGRDNVAVVDSNSKGIMQSLLSRTFGDDRSYPKVRGYYFNLLRSDRDDQTAITPDLSRVRGFISDWRRDSENEQSTYLLLGKLIEVFSHPNHGITAGYRESNGRVVPIFKRTSQECQTSIKSEVQRGILAYARDYATYYALHNYGCEELLESVKSDIRKWVMFPPKRDVEALKDLFVTDDWPRESDRSLINQITLKDVAAVIKIRNKVASSEWPQGTLRLAPVPGLNLAFFYYRKLTGRRQGRRVAS